VVQWAYGEKWDLKAFEALMGLKASVDPKVKLVYVALRVSQGSQVQLVRKD
jgi:hypothetical protein